MSGADPYAVIEYRSEVQQAEHEIVREAVNLIENDRPNAARRLLIAEILQGRCRQNILKSRMDEDRERQSKLIEVQSDG